MWWDDLNDIDYQDKPIFKKSEKLPEFYFRSITSRHYIINAVTGEEYPYRIGSMDEGRFYVVVMGNPKSAWKDPMKLFFDSPEQYERATGNVVWPASRAKFQQRKLGFP